MAKKKNNSNPMFLLILTVLLFFSIHLLKKENVEDDIQYSSVSKKDEHLGGVDWQRGFSETERMIQGNKNEFVNKVSFELDEEAMELFVGISLERKVSNNELIAYIEKIIYVMSKEASYHTDFRQPSKQILDYGELFDYYNILIGVSDKESRSNTDEWLVYYKIPKASHKKIRTRS